MEPPDSGKFHLFGNMNLRNIDLKKINIKNIDRKKKLIAACCCILVCALVFVAVNTKSIYAISVDGEFLGNVKDESTIKRICEEAKKSYEAESGTDVEFIQEINVEKVKAWGKKLDSEKQVLARLCEALSVRVKSVCICINDKEVAVVKDKTIAEETLNEVKDHYINMQDGELLKVEAKESVKLVEKFTNPENILSLQKAKNVILQGTPEVRKYEIKQGDTLWSISKEKNVTLDDLIKANKQLKSEDELTIGDKINLTATKPLLNVTVAKKVTYQETIPFSTETVKDNSLWKWDQKVKQAGENGKREIVAEVVYTNGEKVGQKQLDSKIVKEPVAKVVAKGTKSQVAYRGSGRLGWPAVGTISSSYGRRGSEFHTGVDIAAKKGSPIAAANSGVVTFTGTRGGYGKLVIIDHGGGIQTYYAHANTICVSKGDKVSKGQRVATIGTTGRATGPHVHFEVGVNGSPTNPMNYLNK